MSYGLLALRLVIGLAMSAHGAQKLFGVLGGGGLHGTAKFFGGLGFRLPIAVALAVGVAEFGGGVIFAAGFLSPAGALAITVVMVSAIATVHWKNGFFAGNGGYELNLVLLTVAVAVAAIGPGRFSVDRALGWDDNLSGVWWGVGVLGVGVALAAATIGALRTSPAITPKPA
jgi:putative oxidoreductase